jgi:flagellar biosynthetic protein FliR
MTLNDFLITEIFTFMLLFCRLGAACMMMPGLGESYISPRIRLLFAIMLTLVMVPTMKHFPAPPPTIPALTILILAEIFIGIFIGTTARLLLSAISTAGTIIAFQSSLASAVVPDVAGTGGQSTSVSNLLTITAMVLLFTLNLHHLLLGALHDSYIIFPAGVFPMVSGMSETITKTVGESFSIAVRLAAPHIVFGLVVNLAAGVIGRLMPTFQVFFIMTAPNLLLSFMLLMLAFNSIMLWYMDYFKDGISRFVGN